MRSAAMLLALAPSLAFAADPFAQWAACSEDAQCVVVQGICNPAAVNSSFKSQAEKYYKDKAMKANCQKQFWQRPIEDSAARCRIERCEIVGKD